METLELKPASVTLMALTVSRVKVSFDPHDNLMDDLQWMHVLN